MFNVQFRIDTSPLANLKQSLVNKVLRKAITKASRIVRDAVKDNAEEIQRLGYLVKAIGIKIRTYSGSAVAVVGPRSQWKRTNGTFTRGKRKGQERTIIPSKYTHFLERGTKHSRAKPVLAPALSSTESQFFEALSQAIKEGIDDLLKIQK